MLFYLPPPLWVAKHRYGWFVGTFGWEGLTQDSVETMRVEFQRRRDYIVKRLNGIPGIHCNMPQGAFYVFPNVKKLLGKTYNGTLIATSFALAEWLLETARIAVVPGEPFGAPGFMRLSYATSMATIENGMDRLEKALAEGVK